jgi:hypothetical protein
LGERLAGAAYHARADVLQGAQLGDVRQLVAGARAPDRISPASAVASRCQAGWVLAGLGADRVEGQVSFVVARCHYSADEQRNLQRVASDREHTA